MGNISINIFCAAITGLHLIYYRRVRDGAAYSLYFTTILVCVFALCMADAGAYYCDSTVTVHSFKSADYDIAVAVYAIDFILTGLVSFFWFLYVEIQVDSPFLRTRLRAFFVKLPLILIIILSILSIKFGWLFVVGKGINFQGPLYLLFFFIIVAYTVTASIHSLYHAFKIKDLLKKRHFYALASFVIFPLLTACLQLFVDIPSTIGLVLAVVWVFLELQGNEVSEDALTGLNNRNRLDREMAAKMDLALQTGRTLYLLMMDADNFKRINDTYGHIEGDKVLKSIGAALKTSVSDTDYFIARFGGDEFSALMFSETEAGVIAFKNRIARTVAKECNDPYSPYLVSLSIGYARFKPEYSATQFYAEADSALYYEKRKNKAKHDARN